MPPRARLRPPQGAVRPRPGGSPRAAGHKPCCTALREVARRAHCLALVTDAFGGQGGIAQYNRDFLGALAEGGAVSSITVLPRHAPERITTPAAISQIPARRGKLAYAATAMLTAFCRRADVV